MKKRILYLINYTGGEFTKRIFSLRNNNFDYFKKQEKILQMLKNTIENHNKFDDICCSFKALKKSNEQFTVFHSKFSLYTRYFNNGEEDLIENLKDRVNL